MNKFIASIILFLMMTLVCPHLMAQTVEYVGILEGGEGTYECFLIQIDWGAGRMLDTIRCVSDLYDDVPEEPPTAGKQIRALFTLKNGRSIPLHFSKVLGDSIAFGTGKHPEPYRAWDEYTFMGRKKNNEIRGTMRSKWFPGDGDRVYENADKIKFVLVKQ